MIGTLTVIVTIDDDDTTNDFTVGIQSDGVDPDAILYLLTAATVAHATTEIRQGLEVSDPLMNATIRQSIAESAARLAVVHEIVHLVGGSTYGISTTI